MIIGEAAAGLDEREHRRTRLYDSYSTAFAGTKIGQVEAAAFRQDVLVHLPSEGIADAAVIDIGCGQGHLVQQLVRHGFTMARGIDISPEQVALAHGEGFKNVECGDYKELLRIEAGQLAAVIATDFIEHFVKDEVVAIFDSVRAGLRPGGVFIVRSPNACSPFFGNYQYGDFTHETVFTPGSFAQLAAMAGFSRAEAFPAPPVVYDAKSLGQRAVWSGASRLLQLALAAEIGRSGLSRIMTQNFIGVATL